MESFLATWLNNCASYAGSTAAFKYGERAITWEELNARVNRLANGLRGLGIGKGDHVTLMFHNCIEFVETAYAIMKIGAVPVPINYRFVPREIIYQTENSDSVAYLFEDLWLDSVDGARKELDQVRQYICFRREGGALPGWALDYEELISGSSPAEPPWVEMDWDDPAVIIYTGGTTGFPKGVLLSYANHKVSVETQFGSIATFLADLRLPLDLVEKAGRASRIPKMDVVLRGLVKLMESKQAIRLFRSKRFQETTNRAMRKLLSKLLGSRAMARFGGYITRRHHMAVLWTSFQLFHDAFFPLLLHAVLTVFMGNILFPETVSFDPVKVMEMLDRERPWLFANTPTGWRLILDHLESVEPDRYDKGSVVVLVTGGGLNPADLKERMLKHFPQAIIWDIFGQTEMSPATTFRFDTARMERKDRAVGKPIVGVRIVDEWGKDVEPGEMGEIIYKSQTVMLGYYKDGEKTAAAIRDGWFHSGDLGCFDRDGEIRVVERKSECINTGAEKVFPSEVEEILEKHPAVYKACVIGVPDPKWGHAVRAVVQLREGMAATSQEILDWSKDQMVHFKRPKSIVFVDNLPTNPVGKILRKTVIEAHGRP